MVSHCDQRKESRCCGGGGPVAGTGRSLNIEDLQNFRYADRECAARLSTQEVCNPVDERSVSDDIVLIQSSDLTKDVAKGCEMLCIVRQALDMMIAGINQVPSHDLSQSRDLILVGDHEQSERTILKRCRACQEDLVNGSVVDVPDHALDDIGLVALDTVCARLSDREATAESRVEQAGSCHQDRLKCMECLAANSDDDVR